MVTRPRDDDAVEGTSGLDLLVADPRPHRWIAKALAHLRRAALVHPVRDRDCEPRGRRRIRVLVRGDVDALAARPLDQRCRLLDLAPVLLSRRLVMRQFHSHAGAPPDLEVLFDRIEKMRRFVPDVAGVEPALVMDDLAERRELVRRSEGARRIDQPRREAYGAFVHRFREERAHPCQLVLRRSAVVRAHHAGAQRPVAHERAHVDRGLHAVDSIGVLAEGRPGPLHVETRELSVQLGFGEAAHRRRRAAAVPAHDERHAHVQRALERVVHEHRLIRMRVDVDESRRDGAIFRVDDPRAVFAEPGADRRDASATYRDIRAPAGRSRPVDHRSAADEEVGHECRRSGLCPRSFRFATTRSFLDCASAGFPS